MRKVLFVCTLLIAAAAVPSARASIIMMTAQLNGQKVVPPSDSQGFGVGTIFFNDVEGVISVFLTAGNLTGNAISAGIYGPADPAENGFLIFPLQDASGQSFQIFGQFTPTPEEVEWLLGGLLYFEIYTDFVLDPFAPFALGILVDGTAEIRGQADTFGDAAIPEPATWTLLAAGLSALGFKRLKRRASLRA